MCAGLPLGSTNYSLMENEIMHPPTGLEYFQSRDYENETSKHLQNGTGYALNK